jgi:hypothetical protein
MSSGGTPSRASKSPFPTHARDMAEGTLRAIVREAGIDISDFLKK